MVNNQNSEHLHLARSNQKVFWTNASGERRQRKWSAGWSRAEQKGKHESPRSLSTHQQRRVF
jgi:hypothetical protein